MRRRPDFLVVLFAASLLACGDEVQAPAPHEPPDAGMPEEVSTVKADATPLDAAAP